jgi:hypothetical protein
MGVSVSIACIDFLLSRDPPNLLNSKDTRLTISSAKSRDLRRNLAKTSPFPFSFFIENPASAANHKPFAQLSEVVWEAGAIGDVIFFVVVVYVDGGDRCAGVDVFDLS